MPRFCNVAGCRFANTHLTRKHLCGRCGSYGHGQIECGSPIDLARIASAPRETSVDTPCTVPTCDDRHSHTTEAHHCASCNVRGGRCPCAANVVRKCPTCNAVGTVDVARTVFTNSDCIVCMDRTPCVIFDSCRHANVCPVCVLRIGT